MRAVILWPAFLRYCCTQHELKIILYMLFFSRSTFNFKAAMLCQILDSAAKLPKMLMLAGLMFLGNVSLGQTNPTPHNLSTSNFSFTGFADGTTTTYPTSIQGHKFSAERTTANLTGVADGDRVLAANSTSIGTGSIRNEAAGGISLLNSGTNHIGAIVIAVNSTGREALKVTFTAQQLNSGGNGATDRINGVRLQYRVGTSGDYNDVTSTEYLSTNTTSQNAAATFTDVALPSACANEPVVQLRWVYYISSGSANGRDRISIDEISVTSSASATPSISLSPASLTGFTTTEGTPSATQTFTVSGDNLSGDLSIAAVTGYEYSLDNSSFSATLTVPVSGGNVTEEPRTVYVRLTGASVGSPAGNATVSGGGASDQSVALSGTVTVFSPVVVINKFSADGLIELLVVNNNADIRGLILKDFPGGADAGGNLVFASTGAGGTLWSSVPAGTLILIDLNDSNTEDVSHADGDFTIWVGGQNSTYFSSSTLAMIDMGNTMLMLKSGTIGGVAQNIHTVSSMGSNALYTSIGSGYKQQISAGVNQGVYNRNLQSAVQNFNTNAQLLTFNVNDPSAPIWAMGSTLENSVFICGLRGGNAQPTASATGINFTAVTETGFTVNWTSPGSGGGANRLVVVRPTAATVEHPVDGGDYYVPSTDFSNPDPFDGTTGTDNVVVYRGSGSSVTVTGLSANTSYTASIYEFNGVTFCADFLTPGHSGSQTTLAPVAPCSELFISEYVEGTSNNKYIEIYNPTSSSIDLGAGSYSLRVYPNGGTTPTEGALSGTIAAFGTVVYKNSAATVYGGTTVTNAAVNFNGDDAVALAKNGVNIDIFGRIGDDPGAAWTLGGNTTVDKTLVRNANVQTGVNVNPTGTGAGAFTTLGTQWTQSNIDVVSNLGSHTCDCFVANPVVTLGINTPTGSEAASTSITLTATADANVTGNQTVQVTLSGAGVTNADFTGVTFPTNITILNGQTTGTLTFTINNDADAEGDETATFTIGSPSSGITVGTPSSQNLTIVDDDNLTSSESVIASVGGEAVSISSLTNGIITNNSTEGTQVWQFRLYDGNGIGNDADDKPTIFQQWTIRPSAGNTVPNWTTTIDNVKFFLNASGTPIPGSFVVNPSSISFIPSTPITVADNGSALISLRISLDNPLAANSDGLRFGFSLVPADVTIETDVLLSSQLGTFTATSNGAMNGIDIEATLQFISAPATVGLGDAFTITVSAIDANGNIDQDDTTPITLAQNTGSGTLTGGSTVNLVNGTYTWTGLSYNVEETFQVIASGGSYSSITANINVVDADYQLFDDFNRADNNTVGIPSSGGSTSWTEQQIGGDAFRAAVNGNQLYLGGCAAGITSGSTGGTGMEQVRFNVENYFETVFDDAGGTLEWYFNMKQTRTDPSGLGSNTYAVAMILGCDENDFQSANADGYAVLIGNGGNPDPVRLVRFAGGLTANANVTNVAVTGQNDADAYYSVHVTFNPCDGQWSIAARDDGDTDFAAPNSGSLGAVVTGTDQTHTGLDLRYFGAAWQHSSSCGEFARFDNFNIPNAAASATTAKEWNGSVSANWNTAANWGPCPGVPTQTDDVIIPNVTTQPIISATPVAYCKDLTVNADAELTINSGQYLNVYGNVANNGVTNMGAGTLSLEGAGTATVAGAVTIANFHTSKTSTLNGTVTVSNVARSEPGGALNANGNLIIQSGAQLLHGTGTPTGGGSVSGNITVRRQGSASNTVYNYWSSPVVGGSLPGSNGYYYDPAQGTLTNADDNTGSGDPGWQPHSGAMTNGQGYASTGAGLASFTGVANNANVTYSVNNPTGSVLGSSNFNLIGNPYPSAISADLFIAQNGPVAAGGSGRLAGALYFWDDDNSGGSLYNTNDYAVWTRTGATAGSGSPSALGTSPIGSVATGQGFKVEAVSSGIITFTNAMRGGNNTQFFKLEEEQQVDRLWLNLTGNTHFNQILVAFRDDATEERDLLYDAYKVRGNANISLGAVQQDKDYSIVAFPSLTPERTVPLMTYVSQADTYTFSADSIEGFEGYTVYLEDLQNGQLHVLQQDGSVNVQMGSQDEYGRFQLRFSPELVTEIEDGSTQQVSRIISSEMGLQVIMAEGVSTNGELRLFNAMGQLLLSESVRVDSGRSSLLDVSGLPAGIYIAAFRSSQGMVNAKVVLR